MAHQSRKNIAARRYLPFIDDIARKAVLVDSYTLGKKKSANSLFMHSMYVAADAGDGPQILKLYVEEMNDPARSDTMKRAYSLQNMEISSLEAKGSGSLPSPVIQTADVKTVADIFAFVKQHSTDFRTENASKVVNADGKKYLYDIVSIKENAGIVFDLNKKARGRQKYAATQSSVSTDSIRTTGQKSQEKFSAGQKYAPASETVAEVEDGGAQNVHKSFTGIFDRNTV